MNDPVGRDVKCPDCHELLDVCDNNGCNGHKEKHWRVRMISDLMNKSPKLRAGQTEVLTALMQRRNADKVAHDYQEEGQ